jgi:hypothetical protein
MRVLFVTPRLPYLPCHDTARLLALGTPVVASGPTLARTPHVVTGQHVPSAGTDDEFAQAFRLYARLAPAAAEAAA